VFDGEQTTTGARMTHNLRKRFWLEVALAGVSVAAVVLTLASPRWIEQLFGVDPDQGSGALEWTLVTALLCTSLCLADVARRERRRTAKATG
jgi:hypothetical protein